MGQPLIVALTGATATGKTAVALALADRLPVSIISLDSALVYRGLDIGTAKPAVATLASYPHALINIRDPANPYSVADFLEDADAAVRAAVAAQRVPLLVGGTMLYLKAFREGLAAMPAANREVRAQLAQDARVQGWAGLYERLRKVDPLAAARIHPNNHPRIERALEVHALSGKPISTFWGAGQTAQQRHGVQMQEFAIHIDDRTLLHARIARRLEGMLAAGFVDEVRTLRARGDLHMDLPAMRAVGYRQVWEYLDGQTSAAGMQQAALAATRQLARRQLTWLRGFGLQKLAGDDPQILAQRIIDATCLEKC